MLRIVLYLHRGLLCRNISVHLRCMPALFAYFSEKEKKKNTLLNVNDIKNEVVKGKYTNICNLQKHKNILIGGYSDIKTYKCFTYKNIKC